jgi:hypothetical protein
MARGPGGVLPGASMTAHGGATAGREAASGATAAGLVPSKTSAQYCSLISFDPAQVALRRIARLKRAVWCSGQLHSLAERGHRPAVPWFVTLTYAPKYRWDAGHIAKAVKRFRNWCRSVRVPCRYTWVGELTQKGVVHYHLLAWLPVGVRMRHWDRGTAKLAAFWPFGMSNTEIARSGVGYLMKYLSKLGEFHRFPEGMRLYGIGGLNDDGKQIRRWYNLPEWCKARFGVGDVRRLAGRLVVSSDGEILKSPFEVSIVPGGLRVFLVGERPERFAVGPYSALPA